MDLGITLRVECSYLGNLKNAKTQRGDRGPVRLSDCSSDGTNPRERSVSRDRTARWVHWTVKFTAFLPWSSCARLGAADRRGCAWRSTELSNEVLILIPYISPEFIDAILGKSAVVRDSQTKSTVEDSLPVHRSRSVGNKKHPRAPSQWNVSWSRYSRLFAVVAKLIVLWLV
jgi:hypothetical protein